MILLSVIFAGLAFIIQSLICNDSYTRDTNPYL